MTMRSLFLQIAAVTTINLKSLRQRSWLSLSTVVAVALVVMVLLSFLAMAILARMLGVELLHRVPRRAFRGLCIELLGLRELRLAEEHDEAVRLLDAGDRRVGREFSRKRDMFEFDCLVLARPIGEAREHGADLVDDLGVIGAERNMGFGVVRLELDRLVEARLHSSAYPLRQRLGDRDFLRIAAERLGMEIEGVGEVGRRRLQRFGALVRLQENRGASARCRS